jgi:hypothetical protein
MGPVQRDGLPEARTLYIFSSGESVRTPYGALNVRGFR